MDRYLLAGIIATIVVVCFEQGDCHEYLSTSVMIISAFGFMVLGVFFQTIALISPKYFFDLSSETLFFIAITFDYLVMALLAEYIMRTGIGVLSVGAIYISIVIVVWVTKRYFGFFLKGKGDEKTSAKDKSK